MIEACGVLLGSIDKQGNWLIEQTQPLRNIFDSSVYFEFDPEELLSIELSYPGQIVGVYHSHPGGFAAASKTDRDNMQRVNQEEHIPWAWLIICGPFDETFVQRAQGRIPEEAILAYHHFADRGLCRLNIVTHETAEQKPQTHE